MTNAIAKLIHFRKEEIRPDVQVNPFGLVSKIIRSRRKNEIGKRCAISWMKLFSGSFRIDICDQTQQSMCAF